MMKAIVTGHSKGLGAALAADLAGRGVGVLGLARSRGEGGAQQQVALDLADAAALSAWLAAGALERFLAGAKQVVLFNNAGMVQPMAPLGRQGGDGIAQAIAVNVTAALMLADALVALTPGSVDRRICHISSGAARSAYAGWSVYGATKAALDQHARCAREDKIAGLRIASIAPGVIDTGMQAHIRTSSDADFPLLPRFLSLKETGGLASPTDTARRLIDYVLSDAFGEQVTPDLRNLT